MTLQATNPNTTKIERRNLEVRVRLTQTEHSAFRKTAGAVGLSLSAWLRMLGKSALKTLTP